MTGKRLKNRLKVHRAMNDWTQEELGRRVNVTRKTINTIENGRFVPSTHLALKLARAFEVAVEDLFQLEDDEDGAADHGRTRGTEPDGGGA